MDPSFNNRQYMCSFELKNEMYIIGGRGTTEDYRNFKVKQNEVEKLTDLPFAFRNGACTTVSDNTGALACASLDDPYACWKFDGSNWAKVGGPKNDHQTGSMAPYNGGAIIIAGYKDRTGSTEFWDQSQARLTIPLV